MDTSGNCFETFEADLEFGKRGEALVCAACIRNITRRLLTRSRRSPVRGEDFVFLGQKVEVKTDRQMAESGNFALELDIAGKAGLLNYPEEEAPDLVAYVEVRNATSLGHITRARVWWFEWGKLTTWVHQQRSYREGSGAWRVVPPKGDMRGEVLLVPHVHARMAGMVLDIWNLERS